MKVSIIVLTYNHGLYLAEALDSILMQQTSFDYEVIIADDCSTDNTRDVIQLYKHKFKHPKLLLNKKNLGAKINLAYAMQAVTGDYQCILEGDDFWLSPQKLQKQVDMLEAKPALSGCAHNTLLYDTQTDEKKSLLNSIDQNEFTVHDFIEGRVYFHTSAYLWRADRACNYPKEMFYNEKLFGDFFLAILHAQKGNIGAINETMSCYRITKKGVWTSMSPQKQVFDHLHSFNLQSKLLRYTYKDSYNTGLYYSSKNLVASIEKNRWLKCKAKLLNRSIDYPLNYFKQKSVAEYFSCHMQAGRLKRIFFNRYTKNLASSVARKLDIFLIKKNQFLFNLCFFFYINRYFSWYRFKFMQITHRQVHEEV